MKYKVLIPSIIIAILVGFFSFRLIDSFNGRSSNQHEVILKTVLSLVENVHYSPKTLDDTFSVNVFNKTIESLDYEKKFFLQSDLDELSKYKYSIDDQLKNNEITFFNALSALFTKRLQHTEELSKKILSNGIHFNSNLTFESDPEKLKFATSESELEDRWKINLTYRVLAKYFDLKKEQDKNTDPKVEKLTLEQLKTKAIESVTKTQERYFKRLNKLNENDRFAIFMNSVTGEEDPHTTFMQPTDKKRFDEMMSGNFIGIGASLQQQDDGRVKITSIITGSPSWKQGSLKADDIIEKVAQGDEAPVDVEGYDIEDVIKMIRGKEGTTVKLTVIKTDGSRQVIPIVRGKVEYENVFAKSAIVEENGLKIGYIILPEFYSNFTGDKDGRKSSTDVEIEIKKLMEENVDGIVMDLRNNGGGSLTDVVDIVGLFVGKGPVVQVRASGDKTMTLNSRKSAPLYTGPLAIMINSGSASASEILAAAIQDYNRGIIIGTRSFGKGTVQKIVPLDQFVSSSDRNMILEQLVKAKGGNAEFDGIGSLKLTIQKFYRINGGSTQLRGVEPDIILPDAFELIEEIGEKRDKNALPWDKIQPSEYKVFGNNLNINQLKTISQKRVENAQSFNLIKETAKRLKDRKDQSSIPLNEKEFEKKLKENEELTKRVEQLDSMNIGLNVRNLTVDLPRTTIDDVSKENNEKWLKSLRKDPYLNETSNILKDWIKQ